MTYRIFTMTVLFFITACVTSFHEPHDLRAPAAFGGFTDNSCYYNAPCPDGRSAEWAQQRVNGDLMIRYLQTLSLPNKVRVAIVDTGFDIKGNKDAMISPNPSLRKADEELGDVARDEVGHGTAVSGLIGAKAPLGLASNLPVTSYRVVRADAEGGTANKYLVNAVEKACNEGHEIINMSWGNAIDENDVISAEKTYAELLKKIEPKGCLLVVAAGNGSIRIERKDINPDDNYLRVEAIAPSGERAYFTSNGEVTAPGQGVFTLLSSNVTSPVRPESLCGNRPGQFINGTSFASPITAALAGQVLNVYKSSARFNRLLPIERIRLVTRTLTASQKVLGHVDGYLAVRIAHAWTKSSAGLISIDELFAFLSSERQRVCVSARKACRNQWQCDAKKACIDDSRQRLSLCGATDKSDLIKDLLATGFEMGAFELTLQAMRMASEQGKQSAEIEYARKKVARGTWDYQYKIWSSKDKSYSGVPYPDSATNNMSFDVASSLIPHLCMRGYTGETSDANQAIALFLNSRQFVYRLSSSEKSGSKEDLELVRNILEKAQASLGSAEALKILNTSATQALVKSKESSDRQFATALTWFRLTERLAKDPVFKDWALTLEAIQNDFAKTFVTLKIKDYIPTSDILKLLKPFLEKHSSLFGDLRDKILQGSAQPEQLFSFYALALLYDQSLPAKQRGNALMSAIESLSTLLQGSEEGARVLMVIEGLSPQVISLLRREIKNLDAEVFESFKRRFWAIGRSKNVSLTLQTSVFAPVSYWQVVDVFDANTVYKEVVTMLAESAKLSDNVFQERMFVTSQLITKYQNKLESLEGANQVIAKVFARFVVLLISIADEQSASKFQAGLLVDNVTRLLSDEDVAKGLAGQPEAREALKDLRKRIEQEKVVGLKGRSYARKKLLELIGKVAP